MCRAAVSLAAAEECVAGERGRRRGEVKAWTVSLVGAAGDAARVAAAVAARAVAREAVRARRGR